MKSAPIEWNDSFLDTKERKVFTYQEHGIPGLRMFGYHAASHAIAPLQLHYHKHCFEFTYMLQGNVRFFVEERSYPLSGGDMYVTFPDEVHSTGDAPMSLHRMYWFQLEADDPAHFLFLEPGAAERLIRDLQGIRNRVIKMDSGAEPLLRQVFENIRGGMEVERLQAGVLLGVLLCQVLRNSLHPSFHLTPGIGKATEYILAHPEETPSLEALAELALLSVPRFKQKFKDEMGTSPRNFVNYQKIEAAKRMLQEGGSVTDTAMNLNFSSTDYFSVVFRRYTSMSPTEFIRKSGISRTNSGKSAPEP